MGKITLYLNEQLEKKYNRFKDRINASALLAETLSKEINRLEKIRKQVVKQ